MKKKWRNMLALVLALVLVGSLAACGSGTPVASTTPSASTAASKEAPAASAEASSEAPADTATGFKENVTIQIPIYDRGVEGQAPVDDNYWTKWIQSEFGDKNNVTVQYVAIPRSDEVNKFNMLLAAGDAPDIIFHYDYPAAIGYHASGAIRDIDLAKFQEAAPTYYQKNVDLDMLKYGVVEGKQAFVFANRPNAYNFMTIIRQDWLDKVGMDMPKNLAEYKAVLQAFKDNKLGGDNTIPATLSLPNAYYGAAAYRDFPQDEREKALYSDLSVAALTWDPVKKSLKDQNEMYNAGLLSPNFALDADASKAKADFVNGVAGVYSAYMVKEGIVDVLLKNVPDAKVSVLPAAATVPEGGVPQGRAYWPFGMILGFNSASSDDEIKATWMFLEWMNQPDVLFAMQNGIEGKTYSLGSDGLPVAIADYKGDERMNYNSNKDMWCLVIEGKDYGSEDKNLTVQMNTFGPVGYENLVMDLYNDTMVNLKYQYTDFLFDRAIQSLSDNKATLQEKWQEYYTGLLMCKPAEFDSLYESYCQEYLAAGFQQILDEKAAAYDDMTK